MKHLGRWLICLGLLLNPIAFIALIALGWVNTKFFLVSLVCYPISLLLIFLARKFINKKCTLYRTQKWCDKWDEDSGDSRVWLILKTIFMPLLSAMSLIMFHLLALTYRKMNEDIEDRYGFSISSIFRTLISFVAYFFACMIIYFIIGFISKDKNYASDDMMGPLMLFCGIVWLSCHILWDILDFAHKENDLFILIKNIVFVAIGVIAVIWGILVFIGSRANYKPELFETTELFLWMTGPLCMHFAYYGVIRTERPPQSKLTYFWGPIALVITLLYSFLAGAIGKNGYAWLIIFHLITIAAYAAVIYFFKLPFNYRDGEYRLIYRGIAKEKRIARANAARENTSSDSSYTPTAPNDREISDVAKKISSKYNMSLGIHVSAITSIDGTKLYVKEASKNCIVYSISGTLRIDLRGKKIDEHDYALQGELNRAQAKLDSESQKICENTMHLLSEKKISFDGNMSVIPEIETKVTK